MPGERADCAGTGLAGRMDPRKQLARILTTMALYEILRR